MDKKTIEELFEGLLKERGINAISIIHHVVDSVAVPIPKEMFDDIVQIIKDCPEYGYEDPSEFVREAIRRFLVERF